VAAYRVPKHMFSVLTSTLLPVDEQGFRDSVFTKAAVTGSDDVQHDPQFAFALFHQQLEPAQIARGRGCGRAFAS
jgi:hypothetical protein